MGHIFTLLKDALSYKMTYAEHQKLHCWLMESQSASASILPVPLLLAARGQAVHSDVQDSM